MTAQEQFQQLIDELESDILALQQETAAANFAAGEAEDAFNAAKDYLMSGADPVNVEYTEAGQNSFVVSQTPNDVGYIPETGFISIQPLPNKNFREYQKGAPNFNNLADGLNIESTTNAWNKIQEQGEKLYEAWINSNNLYSDWQQKEADFAEIQSRNDDAIDQKNQILAGYIEAQTEAISSGLTPEQAAQIVLDDAESNRELSKTAVYGILALGLLFVLTR